MDKPPVIVQARMSSLRFPGKILHKVAGVTLLEYLLQRLKNFQEPENIVICTSTESSDDVLEEFCSQQGVLCFRGDLNDVAHRFIEVLDHHGFEQAYRISGDSPLLDPILLQRAFDMWIQGSYDIVSNVSPKTFPSGQSVELFSTAALKKAYASIAAPEDKEHVTTYFYKNRQDFKIAHFEAASDYSQLKMSVDTRQDMALFESVMAKMDEKPEAYGWLDLLSFYS